MNVGKTVTFTLGGMVFEYDEEKNRKIFKNTAFHLKALPVCFSTITE